MPSDRAERADLVAQEGGWVMAKLSNCRSCSAEIRWVKTEQGKNMPVDADPVDDGNLAVDWDQGVCHYLKPPDQDDYTGRRYTSHFATCPNAKQHRKPKQTDAEIDAARDKAIAAVDKKHDLSRMAEEIRSAAEAVDLMLMVGEAIGEDVEAWEPVQLTGPSTVRTMLVTWHGNEFEIRIERVKP